MPSLLLCSEHLPRSSLGVQCDSLQLLNLTPHSAGGSVSNAGNGGNVVISNGGNTVERLSTSHLPDAALRMTE